MLVKSVGLFLASQVGSVFLEPVNPTRSFQEVHTFVCQAQGGPGSIFQWTFEGSILKDADITSTSLKSTLTINNVSASDGGEYICTVSNIVSNASNSSTLYVSPYIVTNPIKTITALNGTSFSELECVAEAFPSPTYTWTQVTGPGSPRTIVDSSDSGILAFTPLVFSNYGAYVCTASSNGLMKNSSISTVYSKFTCFSSIT